MKKNIIIAVLTGILSVWAFFLGYNQGKSHAYSAEYEYYNRTEALLDSIYEWDESFMNDFIQETDVYYEYELSRENLYK